MVIKILLTLTALLLITSQCSSSPSRASAPEAAAPSPSASDEYLGAHNTARVEVGVGPLKWSEAVAKSASLTARIQRDKQNCSFANLGDSKYGANQLWAGGLAVGPRAVVEAWVAEKKFYNYGNNSCAGEHRCGVYTQVVWRKTAEVGCAQAACGKVSSLTICLYNPPGNVVGEKPY